MSSFYESARKNISTIRESLRYNQSKVSSELSVDQSTVSKWEKGKTKISLDTLEEYSKLFHVSPNQLLGYEPITEESFSDTVDLNIMDALKNCKDIDLKLQILEMIEKNSQNKTDR